MQLYYIRHGQSNNNALASQTQSNRGRHQDPELTETGEQQAQHLAAFLSRPLTPIETANGDRQNVNGFGLTHIYSSLMVRAVATATAIGEALGLPVQGMEDLHEEWGIYLRDPETGERVGLPGKGRAYFEECYPNFVIPEDMNNSGWWNRPAEPVEARRPRAQRIVAEILERHGGTDDRVALVSHGGTYQHFMSIVLSLPPGEDNGLVPGLRFSLNNTGITRIDWTDRTRIAYANRLDHLPRHLVT